MSDVTLPVDTLVVGLPGMVQITVVALPTETFSVNGVLAHTEGLEGTIVGVRISESTWMVCEVPVQPALSAST
jgi:hypothetical protein